jgi:hypothetical protein
MKKINANGNGGARRPQSAPFRRPQTAPTRRHAPRPGPSTFDNLILGETSKKEEKCRENFRQNSWAFRVPVDPVNGTDSNRNGDDFAIPFHHSIALMLEEQNRQRVPEKTPHKMEQFLDQRDTTYGPTRPNPLVNRALRNISKDVPQMQNLRLKSSALDAEILQMQQIIEANRSGLQSTLERKGPARM